MFRINVLIYRVKDAEKSWVKLEWSAPRGSDSSSEVTHYIIEKLETFMVPKLDDEDEDENKEAEASAEGAEEGGADQTEALKVPRPALKSMFSGEFQEYQSKWMQVQL